MFTYLYKYVSKPAIYTDADLHVARKIPRALLCLSQSTLTSLGMSAVFFSHKDLTKKMLRRPHVLLMLVRSFFSDLVIPAGG